MATPIREQLRKCPSWIGLNCLTALNAVDWKEKIILIFQFTFCLTFLIYMDLSEFISIYKIIIKIMINVNKMPSKTRAVSLIFTSFIFFHVHGTFLSAKKVSVTRIHHLNHLNFCKILMTRKIKTWLRMS